MASRLAATVADGALPRCCQARAGTVRTLPPEARFDAVLYIDVLEHVEDDAAELAAAARVLRPGGSPDRPGAGPRVALLALRPGDRAPSALHAPDARAGRASGAPSPRPALPRQRWPPGLGGESLPVAAEPPDRARHRPLGPADGAALAPDRPVARISDRKVGRGNLARRPGSIPIAGTSGPERSRRALSPPGGDARPRGAAPRPHPRRRGSDARRARTRPRSPPRSSAASGP